MGQPIPHQFWVRSCVFGDMKGEAVSLSFLNDGRIVLEIGAGYHTSEYIGW